MACTRAALLTIILALAHHASALEPVVLDNAQHGGAMPSLADLAKEMPKALREEMEREVSHGDAAAPTDTNNLVSRASSAMDAHKEKLAPMKVSNDLGDGNAAKMAEREAARQDAMEEQEEMKYQAHRGGMKDALKKYDADNYEDAVKQAALEAEYQAQETSIAQEKARPHETAAREQKKPWELDDKDEALLKKLPHIEDTV